MLSGAVEWLGKVGNVAGWLGDKVSGIFSGDDDTSDAPPDTGTGGGAPSAGGIGLCVRACSATRVRWHARNACCA